MSMRPLYLSLLPLIRFYPISAVEINISASARISTSSLAVKTIPSLSYPICVRNFTCAPRQKQDFQTIMADIQKEDGEFTRKQNEQEELDRLAKPAIGTEAEILNGNSAREEAAKLKASENKKVEEGQAEEVKLPKLSAADFRTYNSMSEHMEYFHNHFRHSWNLLYNACVNNKRPQNLSIKQFINTGLQFCSHLSAHHGIEEQHIFPLLAQKMPEFKNGPNAAELLRQHKEIHKGMDVFEEYLRKCKSGEADLELSVLKTKMDTWGEVLWKHLDQEVVTLGAENMRKYWTLEEMRRMPM